MKLKINCHSSICINDEIYFDPFRLPDSPNKAKIIFITHTHYDHLSEEDIAKIATDETIFVATKDATCLSNFPHKGIIYVSPNEKFTVAGIAVSTFASYNTNKDFHKKEYGWVGYKITLSGETIIVVGDSDATEELKSQKCDTLIIPIGGTYTMTAEEASEVTNTIKPKTVIPSHYAEIVGEKTLARRFKKLVSEGINVKILIK